MLATESPSREDLVRRASDIAPLLRGHAAWAEENRRIHDESIEALADAGIFKMRVPARFGGYESDTRTLVEVGAELGWADGSTGWTASVYWIPTWMVGMFPESVQEEVFAVPDVRVCGTLSPTATAVPANGGIVVNGRWGFQTGAAHSHWQEIIAVLLDPNSQPAPVVALVPTADVTVVDDWHTTGLAGTGSVTTVAEDLFVPNERVLPLGAVLGGRPSDEDGPGSRMYRAPLLPVASASSVGAVLGMATAARDAFFERLPGRKITYTAYDRQSDAALTHLQAADAVLRIDEARFHARRLADLVDGKIAGRAGWTVEERVLARADLGRVCELAKEAVGILATASGGSSIYRDVPIQRINRDVQAVNLHALMHPNTNTELYGRVLCGLEPNTPYI